MSDDVERTEVGKLRDGFLTDEQGRRIHVPPFGPPRWVPSLEEEDNLRRLKFRVLFVAMIVAVAGATAFAMWWDEAADFVGVWVALALGTQTLAGAHYVRPWAVIPRSEFSYAGYVMGLHERRSLLSLCIAVLSRILACVGIVVGLIWLALDFQPRWSDLPPSKAIGVVILALMLPFLLASIALSAYRAWTVLRKRLRTAAA